MKKYFLLVIIILFFGFFAPVNLLAKSFEVYPVGENAYPALTLPTVNFDGSSNAVTISTVLKDISGVCSARATINSAASDIQMQHPDQNNDIWVTTYTKSSGWTPGTYSVNIFATDCLGNDSMTIENKYTNIASFTVYANLTVTTQVSSNPAVVDQLISFSATPSGGTGTYSYSWAGVACNNGTTNQTCQTSFSTAGNYTATVTVTSGTQTATASATVAVYLPLTVTATALPSPALLNQTVNFSAYAQGGTGTYSYSWTGIACSNGTTHQTCTKSFSTAGNYTATVTVTSGGLTANASATVAVYLPLTVTASALPSSAYLNQQVTFSSTPSGGTGTYSYAWSGACDGGVSQNCARSFSTAGNYTATVTVTSGTQTATASATVTVYPALTVTVTALPNPAVTGQIVVFSATPSGGTGTYSYSWTGVACFNGTANYACEKSFLTAGNYTATVRVTSGAEVTTVSATVTVSQALAVTVDISPNPALLNQTVSFSAYAQGGTGTYSYSWTGVCSGTNNSCERSFSTAGNYTATVTVTSGTQTATASATVAVSPPLNVTASVSPNPAVVGETVSFSATPSGGTGTYSYNWIGVDCNNGNTNQNCQASFFTAGNYSILVNVVSGTQTATANVSFTVYPALIVLATALPNPATPNQAVNFSATVSGGTGIYSYIWAGDCSGTNQTCLKTFYTAGNYTAMVTVTSGGQTVPASAVVTVAQNSNKAITAFNFNALSPAVIGTINETNHTVALTVPYGTSLYALVPTITINGTSVSPASGVSRNFTSPQAYTVTASDNSTQNYTVTVTVGAPTTPTQINIFTINPATASQGGSATFSATLTTTNGGAISNKIINFYDGATIIATGMTNYLGNVSVAYNVPATSALGAHNLQAKFDGDSYFSASVSAIQILNVTAAASTTNTTTTFNMNPTTIVRGGYTNISATLTNLSTGAGIQGKTINFVDLFNGNSTIIATGTTDSNGNVSTTYSVQFSGWHSLHAEFLGDSSYNGSVSASQTLTVQ